MNNKPVAYGRYIENAKMWLVVELDADMPEGYIPLYTHPVKELDEQFKKGFEAGKKEGWKAHKFHHPVELTDEEINKIADMFEINKYSLKMATLEILRKAQEK